MATWNKDNILLTGIGYQILSKVQAGIGKLTITRVVTGGTFIPFSQLYALTALPDIRQELSIGIVNTREDGSDIEVSLNNLNVTKEYNVYCIGFYATHPDINDGNEVLYMVSECDNTEQNPPDHIPLPSDTPINMSWKLYLAHQGTKNITIKVDPTHMVTVEMLDVVKQTIHDNKVEITNSLASHTGNSVIHVTQDNKNVWFDKYTKAEINAKVKTITDWQTAHKADMVAHITSTERARWNNTYTKAEVDTKDKTINDALTAHKNDTLPHVTQANKDRWNNTYTKAEVDSKDKTINDALTTHKADDDRHVKTGEKMVWSDKYTKAEIDNKFSTLEMANDWKEAVATYADLAKTYPKPEDGWTVNVKDNDITYRWSGSAWVAISANSIPMASATLDGKMSKTHYSWVSDIPTMKTDIASKASQANFTTLKTFVDGVNWNRMLGVSGTLLPTGTNLDNIATTSNIYGLSSGNTYTNMPTEQKDGTLMCLVYGTTYCNQILYGLTKKEIWYRSKTVGAWNAWQKVFPLTKADVGLGNADNTSDVNKPISNAVKTELTKYPKILSTTALSTTVDWNTLTALGFYALGGTYSTTYHAPQSALFNGVLAIYNIAGSTVQYVYSRTENGTCWWRGLTSGSTWGAWQMIIDHTKVINNVTTSSVNQPLSAEMGRQLHVTKLDKAGGNMTGGIAFANSSSTVGGTTPGLNFTGVTDYFKIYGEVTGADEQTAIFETGDNGTENFLFRGVSTSTKVPWFRIGPGGAYDIVSGVSKKLAREETVNNALALKAPIASPTFTGSPKAPTTALSSWDTSIATTAYVKNNLQNFVPKTWVYSNGSTNAYVKIASITGKGSASADNHVSFIVNVRNQGTNMLSNVYHISATTRGGANPNIRVTNLTPSNGNDTNSVRFGWADLDANKNFNIYAKCILQYDYLDIVPLAMTAANVTVGTPTTTAPTGWTQVEDVYAYTTQYKPSKSDVGLPNVDNTSDASKPVSTATQTALNLKANLASPTFTGNPKAPTPAVASNDTSLATTAFVKTSTYNEVLATGWGVANGNSNKSTDLNNTAYTSKNGVYTITSTLTANYPGNLTQGYLIVLCHGSGYYVKQIFYGLSAGNNQEIWARTMVNKVWSAWGKVYPLTKTDLGLGNVNNTADSAKPISTATQNALNLKANLASPSFTGAPLAPSTTPSSNTTYGTDTQLATHGDVWRYHKLIQMISEDLDTYTWTGVYHNPANANATTAKHYPEAQAGLLRVYNSSTNGASGASTTAMLYQEYWCYNTSKMWRRAKYTTGAWSAWQRSYLASETDAKIDTKINAKPQILSGTADPASSLGKDGDIYLQYK